MGFFVSRASGPRAMARMPRYSWLGWRSSQAMRVAVVCALLLGAGLVLAYLTYLRDSPDAAPDSPVGVGFAVAGTLLFVLVGAGYVARKRLPRLRRSRALQTALSWHIVGGVLALALILMHAAGNFHPRSGTYALYGLIAVVVSGLVGRAIDRFCPRIAAMASLRAVQTEGAMRARLHRHHREEQAALSASARHRIQRPPTRRRAATPTPTVPEAQWDLAYYDMPRGARSLPPALSAMTPLPRMAGEGPGVGAAPRPMPDVADRASQSADILAAMERMRFAVTLVRVWRHVHQLLCVVTVGLIIWHLVFAATLFFGW